MSLKRTDELERAIINLARRSIEHFFQEGSYLPVPSSLPEELLRTRAGCFVTLYKHGFLRGCIGTIEPTTSCLAEEIIRNAVSSAFRDPRFPPLQREELREVNISVDVLSPPIEVKDISELDPKRWGVIVERGFRRGVLLPDLEGVDTVQQQLSIALRKANISPHENYKIYKFEVIRFGKKG